MRRKPILAVVAASAALVSAAAVTSSASAAVSKSTTQYFLQGGTTAIKGVKVSGYDGRSVYVAVKASAAITTTTASVSTTTGLTLPYGYSGFSGPSIAFTGTQDAVNKALASLQVTVAGSASPPISVTVTAFDNGSALAYNPDNEHFYKYVAIGPCAVDTDSGCTTDERTARNPETAKAAAEASTAYGQTGYLASITSSSENAFVASKIKDATAVIIGGRDSDAEGTWTWVGGPDNGTAFWRGCSATHASNPGTALGFAQWSTGEPNNFISGSDKCGAGNQTATGEDCMVTNWTDNSTAEQSGYWNDVPCGNDAYTARRVRGYVIEYGNLATGGAYTGVDVVTSSLTIAAPKPTFLDTLFGLLRFNKKALPKAFKITVKKSKTKTAPAKTTTCPTNFKKTRFSYTLQFKEAGRYSFYFTNASGTRLLMQCGTKVKTRVLTEAISAPVIQSVKDGEKPVITAYIRSSEVGRTTEYPMLNVILRRPDGTLVRQDQPNPPLPGTPIR